MSVKLKNNTDLTLIEPFFKEDFHRFCPFDPILIDFCSALSDKLFEQKQWPDMIALAFWLRRGHIEQLKEQFHASIKRHSFLMPSGLVFHITPANIEAMFLYSWLTSLLCGNGNILRLPGGRTPRFEEFVSLIKELLIRFKPIQESTLFVEYGHEEEITRYISQRAAIRVIWGGDETIEKIRMIPLNPRAREIAFPDRFSIGLIHAARYLDHTGDEKDKLAAKVYQDIYNFDQAACSSPRLLYWYGNEAEVNTASDIFYEQLQQKIEAKKYEVSLGGALLKQTYLYNQALDLPLTKVKRFSNELSIAYVETPKDACRLHPGQGLIYQTRIESLSSLAHFITPHDQTLTYYGFSEFEMASLIITLNGQGITRVVPMGQALNFETIWDGMNLFSQFTQEVTLQ